MSRLRRHLIAIIRDYLQLCGMTWADFRPHDSEYMIGPNSTVTLPFDTPTKTGV